MTSKAYHNTLARYNGYFLAKERMKVVRQTVAEGSQDNFSRVLKVYPTLTSATVSTINPDLEYIIKKASLPIQRHKNSKWVDNSYTLVGMSRYYRMDYDNAAITFKYVNSTSEDEQDKAETLTWLLRTFTQTKQYNNAFSVISHLSKKKLTDKNKELFSLAKAELYQKIEEEKSFLKSMKQAAEVVKSRNNKARVNFIMGQLNQEAGNNTEAYRNFTISMRKSPTYEMEFYSKLYRTQVTDLSKKEPKKVIKYYNRLLKDEKNEEYKDKIYYEMANFEYKQEKLPSSIDYLSKSLRANKDNVNQKAYSYLMKAEIYYEDMKNYRQASLFYDSTYAILDTAEEKYPEVKRRAEVLKEFVKNLEIIERQDSLQRLAKMDTTELYAFIDKELEKEEKARIEEMERKKQAARNQQNQQNQGNSNMNILNNAMSSSTGSKWYFYNPNLMNRGKMAFQKKWGERDLADNWRRESKKKVAIEEEEEEEQEEVNNEDLDKLQEERMMRKRNQKLKEIPFTEEEMVISDSLIEGALYVVAEIYHLNLLEPQEGSDTYEEIVKRYPRSEDIDEVYYTLYIINKELDKKKSEYYKNKLLNEYPNSVFAKLIHDPDYLLKNEQLNRQAKGQYAIAYGLHQQEMYDSSYNYCNQIIEKFPQTDIMDKLVFLKTLNIGMQDTSVVIFKRLLENFIESYQSSELLPLANEYLNGVNAFINKKIGAGIIEDDEPKVKFSSNKKVKHYFVSVFDKGKLRKYKVINKFAQFNDVNWASEDLKPDSRLFGNDKFVVRVSEFKNGKKAMNYYKTINVTQDILGSLPDKNHDSFVISVENYNKFMDGKYLDEYISFFREKYIINEGKNN